MLPLASFGTVSAVLAGAVVADAIFLAATCDVSDNTGALGGCVIVAGAAMAGAAVRCAAGLGLPAVLGVPSKLSLLSASVSTRVHASLSSAMILVLAALAVEVGAIIYRFTNRTIG